MSEKGFSPEEVDEILRRALARQEESSSGVKRDELVAAAGEVGIDQADVDAAIAEMNAERAAKAPKPGNAAAMTTASESRRRKLRAFYRHLGIYVVVNAALFAMNMMSGGRVWFYWALFGWGIGVASHGLNVLFPKEPRSRGESRKERRRARGRDFESEVERGVEKILAKRGARVDVADVADVKARVAGDGAHDDEDDEALDERRERKRRAKI